jgi:hypothetical protein
MLDVDRVVVVLADFFRWPDDGVLGSGYRDRLIRFGGVDRDHTARVLTGSEIDGLSRLNLL